MSLRKTKMYGIFSHFISDIISSPNPCPPLSVHVANVANELKDDDKFKYIYDLAVVDAVKTREKLKEYKVWNHVPKHEAIYDSR